MHGLTAQHDSQTDDEIGHSEEDVCESDSRGEMVQPRSRWSVSFVDMTSELVPYVRRE